ncbi:MAG: hypothetical protein ACKV0T_31350, partial [Planctomycetales bacterium]
IGGIPADAAADLFEGVEFVRRSIALTAFVIAVSSATAFAQQPPAAPAGTNTITVVLPSLKNFYDDLKVPFDLASDPKGYTTLIDTLEVFVVGIQHEKPLGVRVMSSTGGLSMTLSLPVKGTAGTARSDPEFQKMLENLWDLDLKTVPPPNPAMIRQVPNNVRTKVPGLRLKTSERLMFSGYDGYLAREAEIVHVGKELADVRSLKGGVPFSYPAGVDLGVTIDGKAQKPEDRLKAFEKIRKELLGPAKKNSDEAQTAFDLRNGSLNQIVAELERFYAESSEIQFLWRLDNAQQNAALDVDLTALPDTELAASAALVKNEPSPYALVSSKDAVIALTSKLPLDSLRKKHADELAVLVKNHVEHLIEADAKIDEAQKTADKESLAILFDAMSDVASQAELTGCLRSWSNGNGHFDTLGVLKVAQTMKFLQILQKVQASGGPITVELSVEQVMGVDLHKLTCKAVQANLPEFISTDGSIYIGLGNGVLWYATGDSVLPRLKTAIQEAAGAPGDPVPPLSVSIRLGPLTEFLASYRKRNPLPEKPKAAVAAPRATPPAKGQKPAAGQKTAAGEKRPPLPGAKRDTTKSPLEQVSTLMGEMDLQAIAAKSFKGTDDRLEFSLSESDGKAHVGLKLDTGLLRFVGTAVSKFVKDNLSDE